MFGLSQALNQVYYTVDQYVKNLQEPEEFTFFDESNEFDSIINTRKARTPFGNQQETGIQSCSTVLSLASCSYAIQPST